jgi:hypothetical protein
MPRPLVEREDGAYVQTIADVLEDAEFIDGPNGRMQWTRLQYSGGRSVMMPLQLAIFGRQEFVYEEIYTDSLFPSKRILFLPDEAQAFTAYESGVTMHQMELAQTVINMGYRKSVALVNDGHVCLNENFDPSFEWVRVGSEYYELDDFRQYRPKCSLERLIRSDRFSPMEFFRYSL